MSNIIIQIVICFNNVNIINISNLDLDESVFLFRFFEIDRKRQKSINVIF